MNPESEGIRDISCSPTAYVGLGAKEAGMAAGGWLSGAGWANAGHHYHRGSRVAEDAGHRKAEQVGLHVGREPVAGGSGRMTLRAPGECPRLTRDEQVLGRKT